MPTQQEVVVMATELLAAQAASERDTATRIAELAAHKQWRADFNQAANEAASAQSPRLCAEYERVMRSCGLKGRPSPVSVRVEGTVPMTLGPRDQLRRMGLPPTEANLAAIGARDVTLRVPWTHTLSVDGDGGCVCQQARSRAHDQASLTGQELVGDLVVVGCPMGEHDQDGEDK